jgi:anoctamin-8
MSKRIQTERAAGIGEWLNVLEFLGACGVITNFVLLYFKHKSATLRMFSSDWDTLEKDNLDLWYFISCILAISLIKILVRELIPDRPQWVIEEIDKINHRDLIQ